MLVLKIAIYICCLVISVLLSLIIIRLRKRNDKETTLKAALELQREKEQRMKQIGEKVFSKNEEKYHNLQIYLSKKGVNYMMKRTVDPVEFVGVKILTGIVIGFVGLIIGGFVPMLIFCIIGFYIPNIIVYLSNKSDNKAMLWDINQIYEILKLKTESGLFLTDSLLQCFKSAQNSRLKDGLLTLTSEIKAKNNIQEALQNFEIKFDNKYVSSFAGVIRQGLETGDTLSAIDNISKQLVSVQKALDIEIDGKTNVNVQITQILVLIEIMVLVFYSLAKFGSQIDIPF